MSGIGRRNGWTLGIVSVALFMTVLDNLVVSVALPTIHRALGASVQSLEWTVNAYVLAYAVLLLTGAALGDRFGRKRMFLIGLALFTVSSAAAGLATTTSALVIARAAQGAGAAMVTPLTLTLLAAAFPGERRGLALGVWSGVSGTAVAVGLALLPIAARQLTESRGPSASLDLRGLVLASLGLLGVVFALVRSQS